MPTRAIARASWGAALAFGIASCGARTGLDVQAREDAGADAAPAGDVPVDDAPVAPDCGPRPAVGTVRFRVPGVVGRVAIGADGMIYAPYATPTRGRGVVAIDACGQERWRTPAVEPSRGGAILNGEVRLSTGGDVLLTSMLGDIAARGVRRFGTDGRPRAPYPVDGTVARFVGLPAGLGPVLVTQAGTTEGRLEGYDLVGRRLFQQRDWSNVNECAIRGATVACLDRAFDMARQRVLWTQPVEILDGTLRHPLPPAIDGDRIYVAFFGLSSYVLIARDVATGRVLWRTELARSTRGQVDLLMGAPVVGTGGTVYVYVNVHRSDGGTGQLQAIRRDGSRAWAFAAPATRTDYSRFATHVVGDAGVIYLGVGRSVSAVGEDGRLRWMLPMPEGVNASAPALSPTGDLVVHTDDDQLVVIATESSGAANTAWPSSNGDSRNANAR